MDHIDDVDIVACVDTALVRTFLAVARHRSFTAAAADLHVVQSTVTTRVKMLEHELGLLLLGRPPARVELTGAGERLFAYAQDVVEAEERLRDAARTAGGPTGDVVLGAPESVCAYRLARVVAALGDTHPDITVHMSPTGTEDTFQRLLDRTLDIGLVLDDRRAPVPLTATTVGSEAISVVAGRQHPAARTRPTRRQLMQYPFFLLEEGCSYTDLFLHDMVKATGVSPRITRFGSIEAARACVQAGLGLSILPAVAVRADHQVGHLVCLEAPRRPASPLRLVSRGSQALSPAAHVVAQSIAHAATEGWTVADTGSPPR